MSKRRLILMPFTLLTTLFAAESSAQPLETFGFQLQPYCNVLTLNITAHGTVFTLDGFDDQCGAAQRASVHGTAFLNPDGSVGIGLTTVLAPGGAFVHSDARINLASLSGKRRSGRGGEAVGAATVSS